MSPDRCCSRRLTHPTPKATRDSPGDLPAQHSRAHPPWPQLFPAGAGGGSSAFGHSPHTIIVVFKCLVVNRREPWRKSLQDKCMIITLPKTVLFFSQKQTHWNPPLSLCTASSDFKLIVFAFSHCCGITQNTKIILYARQRWGRREKSPEETYYTLENKMINARPKWKQTYEEEKLELQNFPYTTGEKVPLFCFPILWVDVERENRHPLSNLPDLHETRRSLETWQAILEHQIWGKLEFHPNPWFRGLSETQH